MTDPIKGNPNATTLDLLNTIKIEVACLVLEGATGTALLNNLLALADRFLTRARAQQRAAPEQEDVSIATEMAVCATAFAVMIDAYFQQHAAATQTRH